jgi:hypothetical protein
MQSLDERMLMSRSRRILVPVKSSEIGDMSAALDDIRPHIHPSCALHVLAFCPPFISGADGDLVYAHGFHHAAIQDATRNILNQFAGETNWNAAKLQTSVCEGGLLGITGAARHDSSDLILLATPGWTASRLARWKVACLRKLSDCPVLVLAQPQRPADGLPISLAAMTRALHAHGHSAPAF